MSTQASAATPTTHRIGLGPFEITVVSDGEVTLPLDFLLPGKSRDEVSALYRAQGGELAANATALRGEVNVTVVKTQDATIVIDCGGGTDFMPTTGRFAANLEAAGIAPDSVTHVVFTHAHADHFWGVFDPFDDATRFSKARHVMPAAEIDYWQRPNIENEVPEPCAAWRLVSCDG
ncbi:MAG: MBL fold metallo-hydrolase [Verrucomicrobiae bacterium]|nr:MBL fold metallo-hydrolase [Verrucomicrobiae bacterium]